VVPIIVNGRFLEGICTGGEGPSGRRAKHRGKWVLTDLLE